MKKIGVLTQPLGHNYGGIMQAYALQRVLENIGYEAKVIDIRKQVSTTFLSFTFKEGVKFFLNFFLKGYLKKSFLMAPTKEDFDKIYVKNNNFINKYIKRTKRFEFIKSNLEIDVYKFDAFVVGSDQVWRPEYSLNMPNFFLDFLENISVVKKISYAASFGVDDLTFSEEESSNYSKLLKLFDKVSVREDSGVSICRDKFGVDAELVLDPTLLLNVQDYEKLIEEDKNGIIIPNSLMCYVLDENKDIDFLISKLSLELNLTPNIIYPKIRYNKLGKVDIENSIYPSVVTWLDGFRNAEFVITDSFHGMVFSILFNKQFLVIGNKDRGLSRFASLLKMLQLESRLIYSVENLDLNLIKNNINYKLVNDIIISERKKSFDFLNNALGL
jgi:hypothetical protein